MFHSFPIVPQAEDKAFNTWLWGDIQDVDIRPGRPLLLSPKLMANGAEAYDAHARIPKTMYLEDVRNTTLTFPSLKE
jgi:hypothetical protein